MLFDKKVAIVTGGAQGIGRAYAKLLSEKGATVVLADIDVKKAEVAAGQIETAGGRACAIEIDVGQRSSCLSAAEEVIERFGGVDYLVNNAGLLNAATLPPLCDLSEEDYQRVLSVNMHSCLYMTQAVYESMSSRGGGAIVNTSSVQSWMKVGVYSVSKVGVNALTANLAHELAPHGIRVNAIAPGATASEGMQSLMTLEQMAKWSRKQGSPTAEVGAPEHIASVGVFLLSEDAQFINGQVLSVDGGIAVRI